MDPRQDVAKMKEKTSKIHSSTILSHGMHVLAMKKNKHIY